MRYKIAAYGWIPDSPRTDDPAFTAPVPSGGFPPSVDLRPGCPPVYDQGELGSCTANAIAGALEFLQIQERLAPVFTPSRLFIYYNERVLEGTVDQDAGAQLRDGITSVSRQGAPPESLWPYDVARFAVAPPPNVYQVAQQYRAITAFRLAGALDPFRGCLAAGYPFLLGMKVFASFETPEVAQTGTVPLPSTDAEPIGGHAVLIVGYDDSSQTLLFRNSWGSSWGLDGYGTLPYAYALNPELAQDFWTIRVVL